MKKHLLKTLLTALVLLTGWGSSAWADEITATLDHTGSSSRNGSNAIATTVDSEKEHYNNIKASGWGGWAYAQFSFKIPNGQAVKSATLKWATTIGGTAGKNRDNSIYYMSVGTTIAWESLTSSTNLNLTEKGTLITTAVIKAGSENNPQTTDVTDAVKAIIDSSQAYIIFEWTNNAAGADLYGKGSNQAPTLVIETTSASSQTQYTVKYTDGTNELKEAKSYDIIIGESFSASEDDMLSFVVDGKKWIYKSGNSSNISVADSASNIVSLVFREAATYNYTLTSSLGTTISTGSDFEGETLAVGYTHYILENDVFYFADTTNKEYRKSIALTENNVSVTVDYTAMEDVNVIYYSEAEDIEGMTTTTIGNLPIRGSKAMGAVSSEDVTITTLLSGKYKIHVGAFTSKTSSQTIYIGYGETQIGFSSSSNLNESVSEEIVLTESTDIKYFGTTSSGDAQFDYIWIEKTGDVTVAAPTFSPEATSEELEGELSISLSCATEGASIYYTIDGTEPTAESTPYSEDFSIGETTTVKAIAVLGDVVSKVAEATYTIAVPFEPVDCTAKVPTDGWQSDQGTVGNFTKDVAQKEQYLTNTTTTEGNVLYQTVTGLDNGTYTVELYANASYTSGRGFASDALNGEVGRVVVFAGDVEMTIPVIHQAGVGTNNIVELKNVVVTDGTLTMGLKKITPGSNWHTIQIKSLTMTSNKAEADANAQNTYWKDVASTIAAYDAYSNVGGSEKSNLVNAETKADVLSSIPVFYAAKTAYNAAKLIADDADGANVDFTSLIVNPSFESGDANGWNYRDTGDRGAKSTSNDTYKMSNSHGNYLFNIWDNNTGYTISQTIASLPSGRYKLQAVVATDANYKMQLKANDNIVQVDATGARNGLEAEVEFNLFDGVLNISADATDNHWYKVDNFRLIFVKAVTLADCVTDYQAALEEANAKKLSPMNATTKGSLEGVINENSDVDQADINALDAATTALRQAITTADASIAAYADAKAALDAMKAVMDGTNVYTAEAYTTYNGVYTANLEKYNAGTLTDDEAKAIENPESALGWHNKSIIVDDFLLSAWNTLPNYPDSGAPYYINTWSVEGDSDGSDFKVPFFEYFTDGGNSLGEKTLTATVSDVENGQYKVTAWVRVETKSGVGATDADGITLAVNDGAGTDVTQGTQIGETRRIHATYEALGLVKDGVLAINFNVAAGNNIHWLSFKNVKYEKVRDLTEEEMAVNPTDIGLDKTEATLTATDNTVTLTPMFTPENATETVTWTSSDESVATVADGVVTGVAPGTATITVTSTLDENVSASCEVTVSYPETEYELSNYTNDGATRTINALSENNLIKNGSFEYPDGFYGWTDATSSAKKLSSSNFEIVTDGDNHYLKAKGHGGATDAKSIGTAWPIENGKTYVFGYKVKSNSAGNSEFHKVSLTNNLGTETKQVSVNSTAVGTGWTDVNYTFTNTENYKYVQLRARWLNSAVCFDDFYLAEATYSLVGNVDYATAAIPTSNIGTGAFQYSQDAINAVNGLVQGEATVADVEAAYDAVTTLNAPAADKLYNVVNISNSYAYKDNALTFKSSKEADLEGNTTAMGWTEKPGSIYPQAIKFTPVEDVKNGYTMSYTRADGNVVYVSTGKTSGLGSNTQQIRPTTEANKALTFVVNSTGENSWTLFNTEDGHSVGSNGDTGFYTAGGSYKDVSIQEAVNNEVPLTILAENQYATLIVPFDATVPAGIIVYSLSNANGNELELQPVTEIKANTPYVVYAEDGFTTTLAGLGAAFTENSYTTGWLTGVYAETAVPNGSYVLQNHDGNVAFYVVDTDAAQPKVQANHAYMNIPSGGDARAYYFGGGATAIGALKALTSGDAEIYDVNGRKQAKLQKGVNIIRTKDGRTQKVMVK